MKFTDGYWQIRDGVRALYAQQAYDIAASDHHIVVTAPTAVIHRRGDTLNRTVLTLTLSSPMPDVIRVDIEHLRGGTERNGFHLIGAQAGQGLAETSNAGGALHSGSLTARIASGTPWQLTFEHAGKVLTSSGAKSVAAFLVSDRAQLDSAIADLVARSRAAGSRHYLSQQLSLGIGEMVYGLGERFGPLVKNGQVVDIWNADGGTSSDHAYKNLPFYVTNRGYGVLVDHPGHVSFEVGSENVERVQFSVAGQRLTYYVIGGGDPAGVIERYTELTGRPGRVPAWSYGTWLSTSFTTDYDEASVIEIVDEMKRRELPLSVFHFDCFWMREFNWCDFEWDPRVFPDPESMLRRLHERGLKICVWINPYIGQRSALFDEALSQGYLLQRPDGTTWQWDLWQAGMGIVDFTNPEAKAWYQQKLGTLMSQGIDAFKTDFGERIPIDVRWHDGSDPEIMHNWYTQLYNQAVSEVLRERAPDDAVVFARSATVGGQRFPVHWGGDASSTFESMAETLRGGLSLAFGGFCFWSHDIAGFEGTPDAALFKRWVAFGMLSTHSRFHGNETYRVPWLIDEEAVQVTAEFTRLKLSLMPYLFTMGHEASSRGLPVMRPMALAFPHDPGSAYVDRQYLLGPDLLVAPVFSAHGDVDVYLPPGDWFRLADGSVEPGGKWLHETHDFHSLPLFVREGGVIARGAVDDRPDYDYLDGLVLQIAPAPSSTIGPTNRLVTVVTVDGTTAEFAVSWEDHRVTVVSEIADGWSVHPLGAKSVPAVRGQATAFFAAR